jgi:Zn-dependent protease
MVSMESASILEGGFLFLIIIYSIILHEIAHGFAAYVQGDETANRAGRLTLNPLPHIDLLGSIIIPSIAFLTAGTFFGWAKPVPYNPHNIQSRFGEVFVASAGVLTNLFIAFCAGVVFKFGVSTGVLSQAIGEGLFMVISVNLSLAFFNLIPIPPFDGMAILQGLFPRLYIRNDISHNPLYMIGAIFVASFIYGAFMPHILGFVSVLIS